MAKPEMTLKQKKALLDDRFSLSRPNTNRRIGKIIRAEVIEWYRLYFSAALSRHIEKNKPEIHRPAIRFLSKEIPCDLPVHPSEYESCPVCKYRPYIPDITVHPRLTLTTEKDAGKYLLELGFSDSFINNYIDAFKYVRSISKTKRNVYGIPDINEFISSCIWRLKRRFPGISNTAIEYIIHKLLVEGGHPPGKGTIKKKVKLLEPKVKKKMVEIDRGMSEPEEPKQIIKDGILKDRANRITEIQRASEKAIKEVEKDVEQELEMLDSYYPD
jgi:hypothetical protein